MRINCEVTVMNRQAAAHSLGNPRAARSSLAICRQPAEAGAKAGATAACIHLCTALNKDGVKYKVQNNIAGVFTRFMSEGKFTLRLKQEQVDLAVKTDPVQAKIFLTTLKAVLTGAEANKLQLSYAAPVKTSQVTKVKTTLAITSKQDYPITTAFPYNLESLTVTGCGLTRIERRMLRLRRLHSLHLSDNLLASLPRELATSLPVLSSLLLSGNCLTTIDPTVFTASLATTLKNINLDNNQLEELPFTFCGLKSLVSASINNNKLVSLPLTLPLLTNLRFLSVSGNKLAWIPAGMSRMALESLNLSSNSLDGLEAVGDEGRVLLNHLQATPSLRELAARACLKHRVPRPPGSAPDVVLRLLQFPYRCSHCGGSCFSCHAIAAVRYNFRILAKEVVLSKHSGGAVAMYCSIWCLTSYRRL